MELAKREIPSFQHIVSVLLQGLLAVCHSITPHFLYEVIGKVGGQSFCPVSFPIIGEDTVSPPIMEDFVRIGGVQNEGKTDDLRPKERKGGHAETCLPKVFYQGKFLIWIRTDEFFIHSQVADRSIQILAGQLFVWCT